MNPRLSTKILRPDFQGEFTASILAAAASPDLISFAGGLPNPVSFPVEAMDKAEYPEQIRAMAQLGANPI